MRSYFPVECHYDRKWAMEAASYYGNRQLVRDISNSYDAPSRFLACFVNTAAGIRWDR